jgi:hypothetical protein
MVAWCRRWLGADPVEVLFRAGYLSEVTGLRLAGSAPWPRPPRSWCRAATCSRPGPDAAGRFASLLAELVRLAPDPAALPRAGGAVPVARVA